MTHLTHEQQVFVLHQVRNWVFGRYMVFIASTPPGRRTASKRTSGTDMGSLIIGQWLIVLAIVLLIFGTRKLRDLGADLGDGMRGFKDAMREGAEKKDCLTPC